MEQFIKLLVEHYEFIVSCVLACCSFISLVVACFRKTRFFRLEEFFDYLANVICTVESILGAGTGSSKFDCVFRTARSWLDAKHLDLSDEELTRLIEAFLSTPEKKNK